jgi:hypothetical protein
MMAKRRRETFACTGRGFSKTDPPVYGDSSSGGYMSRLLSFATRPNDHGTTMAITSSTYATSTFNLVGHGLSTGQSVALTTSGSEVAGFTDYFSLSASLVFPLTRSLFTEYFVIKLTDDTFQLAVSFYNAMKTIPVPVTFTADISSVSVTPLGGGANWYLHDDFSRLEPVDFATTAVDTSAETITLTGNAFSHMQQVTFSSTGTVPGGLTAGTTYWLSLVSSGVYKVCTTEANAYAGTGINLTSQGTGTHTITTAEYFVILTDTLSPTVNDYNTSPAGCAPKFIKVGYLTTESGYVRMQGLLWWDKTNHIGRVFWAGYRMDTYDSATFAYQLIGGDEFLFQASQLGATWYKMYIDTFTGFSSKLEAITKVGILQSGITAGSSKVCQLDTGEAANFTANKYYYIYDLNGHGWVGYTKVEAVDTGADTITISVASQDFPAGSVVIPYAHRYYMHGKLPGSSAITNLNYYASQGIDYWSIPYCSSLTAAYVIHSQNSYIKNSAAFPDSSYNSDSYLSIGDPDDEGYYDCMRHVIGEEKDFNGDTTSMNRIYGKSNNIIKTARGSMGQMVNTRTLLGIEYLSLFGAGYVFADMVTYTESDS